jgi:hypothetical protein
MNLKHSNISNAIIKSNKKREKKKDEWKEKLMEVELYIFLF